MKRADTRLIIISELVGLRLNNLTFLPAQLHDNLYLLRQLLASGLGAPDGELLIVADQIRCRRLSLFAADSAIGAKFKIVA